MIIDASESQIEALDMETFQVNLAVAMATALLRPELPVVARTVSTAIAERMRAFGTPTVVNPFDRFGNHLRIALRAPASYQLLEWLEAGPGAPLPNAVNRRWTANGWYAHTAASGVRSR